MPKFDPAKIIKGSFDRVKLGSGLTGKLTTAVMGLFGVLGIVAYGLYGHEVSLLWLAGAAILVFLAYAAGVAFYAIRYPDLAILEGADLIKWRQLDMSAADPTIMTDEPNTLPPPKAKI